MCVVFVTVLIAAFIAQPAFSFSLTGGKAKKIKSENGMIKIATGEINDGKAHFFKTKADDGVMVTFFVLKSRDGVIRAAIDACDVCYRSGKGYHQEGDFMICDNCGRRFASTRINEVKGGCNPAPLERKIVGKNMIISMADINKNSWYCDLKK